jgi:hypothetical protein
MPRCVATSIRLTSPQPRARQTQAGRGVHLMDTLGGPPKRPKLGRIQVRQISDPSAAFCVIWLMDRCRPTSSFGMT